MRISDCSSDVCSSDLALAPQQGSRMAIHYLDIVLGATATVNCLHLIRGYCARGLRRAVVQMIKASLAWFVAFGSLMAIAHAAGESREFPGVWGGVWFGSVWLFLCTSRWAGWRSEEHTSELKALMRISYAVLRYKNKKQATI